MFVIIDGNNLAFRCYYAIDPLTTSYGKAVNLTYGCLIALRAYVERYGFSGNRFFITWDSRGKNFRHELYPNYKADRKTHPTEFYEQLKDAKDILQYFPITQIEIENCEADDIVGSLTFKARKLGKRVLVISSDHDFEQLITKQVKVLAPSFSLAKEKLKDISFVFQKYGLKPKQLPELMAIIGDDSDNIDGIEGIAEKRGADLLYANDCLEKILTNSNNLKMLSKDGAITEAKSKLKEKIIKNLDIIRLNKKLVTIRKDIELDSYINKETKFNIEKVKEAFKQLEFKKFLSEIEKWQDIFST